MIIPTNPTEFLISSTPDITVLMDSPIALPIIGIKLPANLIVLAAAPSADAAILVLKSKKIDSSVIDADNTKVKMFFTVFVISLIPFMAPTASAMLKP